MSYHTEHQRMKPVLDFVRAFDISRSPNPRALYLPGNGGFDLYVNAFDYPKENFEWREVVKRGGLVRGAYAQACAYIGSVCWKWEDESVYPDGQNEPLIVGIELSTTPYVLGDHFKMSHAQLVNRPADITWARLRIHRAFHGAQVPALPIFEVK